MGRETAGGELRQAKAGVAREDAEVAREGELETGVEGATVDERDHRHAERSERCDAVRGPRALALTPAEIATARGEHDHAHRLVVVDLFDGPLELGVQLWREQRARQRELDDGAAPHDLEQRPVPSRSLGWSRLFRKPSAELVPEDLAEGVARQLVEQADDLRLLEARKPRTAVLGELLRRRARAGL